MADSLKELLEKYNYNLPKTYEQKINERIKKIGKKVGIVSPIEREQIKGGLKVKTTIPKYELIKTHSCRRSGATNMYKHGIPVLDIMKITTHKTEISFLTYIKISKEETADRITKDHFISKPLKKVN